MIMPGDIFVAISSPEPDRPFDQTSRVNQVAEALLHNNHLTALELADLVKNELSTLMGPHHSLASLVAKRDDE